MSLLANTSQKLRSGVVRSATLLGAVLTVLSMTACTHVMPPQAMTHSPQFAPV